MLAVKYSKIVTGVLFIVQERVVCSGQIVGERGGTAFPFRFWRGNAVPLAHTTAVGGGGGKWRTRYTRVHSIIS